MLRAFVIVLAWLPSASFACAVCGSGNDEDAAIFTITTAFLTLLPLIMIAGLVRYAQKKWAAQLEEERQMAEDQEGSAL